VNKTVTPFWELVATQYQRQVVPGLQHHVDAALASEPVRMQRALLAARGRTIADEPMLWKQLPGNLLRLFVSVEGGGWTLEAGQVVAVVLLHDLRRGVTLYAHPVHAGPEANPLLKHLHGPMAAPRAQEGINGERATLRLIEHKRAIWHRFLEERDELGPEPAGRRWRKRYVWSLVRLYFCERCPGCRWGSPMYEGVSGEPFRLPEQKPSAYIEPDLPAAFFERLRASRAWRIETAYVARGGFTVGRSPVLAGQLADNAFVAAFPTDAEFIDGGIPVGLMFYANGSGDVQHVHVLTAGPEPELALLHGDHALGLAPPQGAGAPAARQEYVRWRAHAWSGFWLRELEEGLAAASRWWLAGYWEALARLFGLRP